MKFRTNPRAALEIAWKSRNHRTTRRTAHQRGIETCFQCAGELPNHCYWLDYEGERVWACSEDCCKALQVKNGLRR